MKKRILIVDDEKAILNLFSEILEHENREIHTAISGSEALKLIKNIKFDLILLDLKMPGTDGTDTFRELRKIDQDVSVFFVTAFQGEFFEKLKNIREDGLSFEILNKPVEKEQLRVVADAVLGDPVAIEGTTGLIRLYAAGQSKRLNEAFEKLKTFLNENYQTHFEYEVIDVLTNPIAAIDCDIYATPTIVKDSPLPSKRIVGDIRDPKKIVTHLGIF